MWLVIAALLVVKQLINEATAADIADGDNIATAAPLCTLLQMADTKLGPGPTVPSADDDLNDLRALNMSLSPESWKAIFVKDGDKERKWADADNPHKDDNKGWAESWDTWAATRQQIKKGAARANILKTAKYDGISGTQLQITKAFLADMVDAAERANARLAAAADELKANTNQAANEKINDAVYGAKDGLGKFAGSAAATAPFNDQAACATDGESGNSAPLFYTFLCVCLEKGAVTKKPCNKHEATGVQWSQVNNAIGSVVTAMRKVCPKSSTAAASPAAIKGAIAAVKAQLYTTATGTYLGHNGDGSCTGTSSAGLCVKYADRMPRSPNTFDDLPWVRKFAEAAAILSKQAEQLQKAERAAAEIKELKTAAFSTQRTSDILAKVIATASASKQSTNTKYEAVNVAACDQYKDNKTACDNADKCKWNGKSDTEGECKPKPEAETTAPGAGETTKEGAATTGCAKHGTDKAACLAEKKDDRPVCAFRTGKDGEPEPNKEMCRNGSFLVNKKFALSVVSAAFVALLF
uniref:Variant surface glycoprotein n=1 Tax=Trypanosoma brucei TaxID=5691 RepID=A0A1V0G098_9TRYP|nr:variant surface glycoprotein [Trypanosoma brucei]